MGEIFQESAIEYRVVRWLERDVHMYMRLKMHIKVYVTLTSPNIFMCRQVSYSLEPNTPMYNAQIHTYVFTSIEIFFNLIIYRGRTYIDICMYNPAIFSSKQKAVFFVLLPMMQHLLPNYKCNGSTFIYQDHLPHMFMVSSTQATDIWSQRAPYLI